MTQFKKELLLRDIGCRLSCGCKVECKISYTINNETTNYSDVQETTDDTIVDVNFRDFEIRTSWLGDWLEIEKVKPYLRPYSDMTTAEIEYELYLLEQKDYAEYIKWLDSRFLDHRGLIEQNLALPSLPGMYDYLEGPKDMTAKYEERRKYYDNLFDWFMKCPIDYEIFREFPTGEVLPDGWNLDEMRKEVEIALKLHKRWIGNANH